jgi:antitoxin component of MazEF toxin-antitoxin module
MTLTRVRKVVRSGGALVVSLPPDWLRGQGLSAGDSVELAYDEIVRVRPIPNKIAASSAGGLSPSAPARRPAQRAGTDEGGLADVGT